MRRREAAVALVEHGDVGRAQEVEAEAHRRVGDGEEADHPPGHARRARVEEQRRRDHDGEQQLVEAEVVARALGVADARKKFVSAPG